MIIKGGDAFMTELSSADFCKLSVQEVADMLMTKLEDNSPDDDCSGCKLYGCSAGRMFELCLIMKEVEV